MALCAANAQASVSTFSGKDNGAPLGGPYTLSAGAESAFLAAAAVFGPTTTETFESTAVGTAAGGGSFSITGGTVSITTAFLAPFGGVSNSATTNKDGFNITSGGANWLGFPGGSATFSFNSGVNAFGFYLTGTQVVNTASIHVTFSDGTAQDLTTPVNTNGGAAYFGFTDDASFTSVTINNIARSDTIDTWGIDNVSYAFGPNSTVPEPATWTLMIAAFGGLAMAMRRRRVAA
jgi:hypothetical protein